MAISSEEAAKTLAEAVEAERRSARLRFYHRSSPHLIMWGTIWLIGFGVCALLPKYGDMVWNFLVPLGIVGGVAISSRLPREAGKGFRAWRMGALGVLIFFFVSATYFIMQPHMSRQFVAYPALITGCAYVAVGLWAGPRYVISGIAVAALTLYGFVTFSTDMYFLWMAVVGGGSMILAGFWFRTV
ncbi:hypothetical protein FHS83_001402 [Rhizomicrobium palustre]|uniref:Uncharacterized protein n=1 Tax=Rhizomicrobium palustre TaxID=189966 RepID=A0A846MX14_9PROT|nr:hypothetical protein [Rhizomicrobium palustre]NIK88084.1 hypothetical protein [Rhizomicrobium palustre]